MNRKHALLAALAVAQIGPLSALADPPGPAETKSSPTVIRAFNQLVAFSVPPEFVPGTEENKGDRYLREAVLAGESRTRWTQMISLSAAKGAATKPGITPVSAMEQAVAAQRKACPGSYSGLGLGMGKTSGYDTYAAVLSCGTINEGGASYSESMLLIIIKGESDLYTLRWTERGERSKSPLAPDGQKWTSRLNRLSPIRLCPLVKGEAAPYPSCQITR